MEYRLNPLTVLKAYQHLADQGLVEKRRGLGMFVAPGASAALMKDERERFLTQDWPRVQATIQRLGPLGRNPVEQQDAGAGHAAAADAHGAEVMTPIIEASGLRKQYRGKQAVAGVDFSIAAGRIVGLIGRNGAGKTTVIKSLLGLTPYEGELKVLGRDPMSQRNELMREVSFIADVAVLPKWLKVKHALDYVQGVHPAFNRARAEQFLAAPM